MTELTQYHKTVYGAWKYFPGWTADPECCAQQLQTGDHKYQCGKAKGYGPRGAFCKKHAEKRK